MRIICLGNYLPRQCGIATFTDNLVKAILSASRISKSAIEIEVIAMNDPGGSYDYPPVVSRTINEREADEYIAMADYINQSGADVLLVQHEFGIFGGESGVLLLQLLRRVRLPIVVTFHTVLQQPGFHQKEVVKKIAELASRIVIMNGLALAFLTEVYGVVPGKIVRIQHGVPDFELNKGRLSPSPTAWANHKVMLTFGLIGRSKGIETVIRALPDVVSSHPELLYVVLGKTHPNIVRYSGEEYREYLQGLVVKLHLEDHVMFIDRYVDELELMSLLKAADLYVTPYLNKAQITSGTLSYAVSGGCAVISTPYWHAEELLADGRGLLFDFQNHGQLSQCVNKLLDNPEAMQVMQQKAYEYGQTITWPLMGKSYLDLLLLSTREVTSNLSFSRNYPPIDFSHIRHLTLPSGLLQHALGSVPSLRHGFCLDDNARALLVTISAGVNGYPEDLSGLSMSYLAYMQLMQQADGHFKNFLSFDHQLTDDDFSDDAFGRSIWALGSLIRHCHSDSMFITAHEMFHKALPYISELKYARGYASCIFGLSHYNSRFPDQERFLHLAVKLADTLCQRYREHRRENWHWFEDALTYANGLIPASLYKAYEFTRDEEYLVVAETTRKFLESKCFREDWLSLVGNKRWLRYDSNYELYAQQPIDAAAMVLMYDSAFKATGSSAFVSQMFRSFDWFFGDNDLGICVYDDETKGCNDGIELMNVNRNQGAESTLAWLMARITVEPYLKRGERF